MLFKNETLEGIKAGEISIAFRKWNKLSVKKSSLIKTGIGIIEVVDVFATSLHEITSDDAEKAGYPNLKSLTDTLNKITTGTIYRILLRYKSPDPRLELREITTLSKEQLQLLAAKLERLDKFSKKGNWTTDILKAIQKHPELKAADLALKVDKEKDWLKLNIRKLKNLGLTISHEPGYTLSPLGLYYLENIAHF